MTVFICWSISERCEDGQEGILENGYVSILRKCRMVERHPEGYRAEFVLVLVVGLAFLEMAVWGPATGACFTRGCAMSC